MNYDGIAFQFSHKLEAQATQDNPKKLKHFDIEYADSLYSHFCGERGEVSDDIERAITKAVIRAFLGVTTRTIHAEDVAGILAYGDVGSTTEGKLDVQIRHMHVSVKHDAPEIWHEEHESF